MIRTITLAAEGAYIHLLATAWDSDPIGTLPNDLEKLRVLARAERDEWPEIWNQIKGQFPVQGRRRINERLRKESVSYRHHVAIQSANGKRGAEARWKSNGNKHIHGDRIFSPLANGMAKNGSASASASANLNTSPLPPADAGGKQIIDWHGNLIEIQMGRRRRIPDLNRFAALHGKYVDEVVQFLCGQGFPSRKLVTQ